ncbi:MAG: YdcF family protein [Ignavibacteriae bacterium]|nr:YdcF family protein [Ignavibacteriota bacterium]
MLFTFFYTFFTSEYNLDRNGKKFDYGIILGAAVWSGNKPSPIFMGRIDKGAELLKNKVINKIQLTGGNAPGELSEAEAALKYLQSMHKLSPKNIEVENLTSTTNEQIKFVKSNLENGDKSKKFIIISDEFHLKRVEEMVDFYNLNAEVISSNYKLNFQKSFYYRLRDSIGLIIFWFFGL